VADNSVAGLAEAIDALREELAKAQRVGSGNDIHFRVSGIELTINAVVTTNASGHVGWGILRIGAQVESAVMQTLKLTFQAVQKTETGEIDFLVADSDQSPPYFGSSSDE
jgi:Trypsin-co-occurring domain 2